MKLEFTFCFLISNNKRGIKWTGLLYSLFILAQPLHMSADSMADNTKEKLKIYKYDVK